MNNNMKNAANKYLKQLKKIIPRWSGSDIGHTAPRDWYTALLLALVLGFVFFTTGFMRFQTVHQTLGEQANSLPPRGLPTTEEKLMDTEQLYQGRNKEFEQYASNPPPRRVVEARAPSTEDTP